MPPASSNDLTMQFVNLRKPIAEPRRCRTDGHRPAEAR